MIFLDTADKQQVLKWFHCISGVTTNPLIVARDGGDWRGIVRLVAPLPVSVEMTTFKIGEAVRLRDEGGENTVIKVPVLNEAGEWQGPLIRVLTNDNLIVNATCAMSAAQCMLAAESGAKYVSLFCGRIADMGHDPVAELNALRDVCAADIIACSVREPRNVIDWLRAGANIVTVPPTILEKMVHHPRSLETVKEFQACAHRLGL